jgi:hypothetical protein
MHRLARGSVACRDAADSSSGRYSEFHPRKRPQTQVLGSFCIALIIPTLRDSDAAFVSAGTGKQRGSISRTKFGRPPVRRRDGCEPEGAFVLPMEGERAGAPGFVRGTTIVMILSRSEIANP